MRAMDVMTTDVITVDPDTTVQALATLLAERGISGAPVVDAEGRLVGIVSEGDLLHRAEIGTARADTASAGVHGGSTTTRPTSLALTSSRMAVRSRTS